jgi:hypothetical protein
MKKSIFVLAALTTLVAWLTTLPAWAQTVKADFRDSLTDGVRSDTIYAPCSVDYVDTTDTCTPATAGDRDTLSQELSRGTYFLRTISSHTDTPTRWLVLNFSVPEPGSSCPNLDVLLSNYPGRSPTAHSPVDPNPCIDLVEVRLYIYKAFDSRVQSGEVEIIIDGPDSVKLPKGTARTQWNEKYRLEFVQPAKFTRSADGKTVTVTTIDHTAELRQGDTLVGTYQMPFQVTLKK